MLIVGHDLIHQQYTCHKEGDTGMYIEGRGVSPLEAIGSWCVYSGKIQARCSPPELLDGFSVDEEMSIVNLKPADRRD